MMQLRALAPPAAVSAMIMPTIVIAQLACTSLWFAGNAVLPEIQAQWNLPGSATSILLSAVQAGFVGGTLVFALLSLSDRIPASTVFLSCAVLGSLSNLAIVVVCDDMRSLVAARFMTGFFLAGIYPVGMKIAASWCEKDLGQVLGYLVGALVVGTALPFLLRGMGTHVPWSHVILICSAASILGGLAIKLGVRSGPYLPASSPFSVSALPVIFRVRELRAAAFGYFGHMWELYAFWAYVPLIIQHHAKRHGLSELNVPLTTFAVISVGAVGCVVGGEIAKRVGSAWVALVNLLVSGLACILSVFMFEAPPALFFAFLIIWGIAVVGDSPQFSSLVGASAPREYVGTAFTIVNCIGFALTAISIHLLGYLSTRIAIDYLFLALAPGPILGLIAARRLVRRSA